MNANPVCEACAVAWAINEVIESYEIALTYLNANNLDLLTEHARGFSHGRTATCEEIVKDLKDLIPYVKIESRLRAKGKKP